jgi:hypothetical protein
MNSFFAFILLVREDLNPGCSHRWAQWVINKARNSSWSGRCAWLFNSDVSTRTLVVKQFVTNNPGQLVG